MRECPYSSRRTLQLAGAVFRYAVATARLASDPTRDLRGALAAPTGFDVSDAFSLALFDIRP